MPTNLKMLAGNRYRVVDDGTDDSDRAERVWCQEIPGKHGRIFPWGFNGDLAAWTGSARIMRRFEGMGLKAVQGGAESAFRFPVRMLDQVASLIRARRRRQLSPEQRQRQAVILAGARERLAGTHS